MKKDELLEVLTPPPPEPERTHAMIKDSEGDTVAISPVGDCSGWINVPCALIVSATPTFTTKCGDHAHQVVEITFDQSVEHGALIAELAMRALTRGGKGILEPGDRPSYRWFSTIWFMVPSSIEKRSVTGVDLSSGLAAYNKAIGKMHGGYGRDVRIVSVHTWRDDIH